MMLKSLLHKEVKINITNGGVRLKSNLTINQTIRFTKFYFVHIILDFTQYHSGEIGDIPSFFQLIPGSYKID